MQKRKQITIIVKAYPEKSKKYGSSICTAGITSKNKFQSMGKWIKKD